MPLLKTNLHSKTGKLKTIEPTSGESTSMSRDSEIDRKFEVELCWCIQHLQTYLTSAKLNQKQTVDTEKTLRILKSGKQPIIKKRQLMRNTFGDYRVKMEEEERKMFLAARQIKFDKNVPGKKSHFVKKASLVKRNKDLDIFENNSLHTQVNQQKGNEPQAAFLFSPSEDTFKFNFNIEANES